MQRLNENRFGFNSLANIYSRKEFIEANPQLDDISGDSLCLHRKYVVLSVTFTLIIYTVVPGWAV